MSRLFPRSLFGQTLLILLAGLIVSHAVGSWIYTADREQAVRAVGGFATAQRIANLTRLVQDTPRETRQRIVAALSDQSFRVSLSAQPIAAQSVDDDASAAQAIKDFLVDQLALGPARQPRVSASASRRASVRALAWDGARPDDARLRRVRGLSRSASLHPPGGWTVAFICDRSARRRSCLLGSVPPLDGRSWRSSLSPCPSGPCAA